MFKHISNNSMGEAYHCSEEGSFGVLNFRDLGISSADNAEQRKYIKEGILFRSATLDNMSQEEVDAFIKAHNIKTILDLRTGLEGKEGSAIDKIFPTTTLTPMKPGKKCCETALLRKKYRIDFAGKNFQRYCVFASCPLPLKLYIIYLMTFCQRKKAVYLIGKRVLGPMGVNRMYKEFATYCKKEILDALMVFVEPANYPIEIHCTQGKDRTGIVSALILSIAGVPEDIIITDYAKTQVALAPIYNDMLQEIRRAGLTEDFAQAPPQNMRDLFSFFKENYGSVNGYLDSINFGADLRQKVREIICL